MSNKVVMGIDVSKSRLDCFGLPLEQAWSCDNGPGGIEQLVCRVRELGCELALMEATGGYETQAATALAAAGLRVAVVNPRQVRHFAKAMNKLAKTDRIDARVLAEFALSINPQVRPLPDEGTRELSDLLARRSQLVTMRTQEKNRMLQAAPALRAGIKTHIKWLDVEITKLEVDLTAKPLPDRFDRLQAGPLSPLPNVLTRSGVLGEGGPTDAGTAVEQLVDELALQRRRQGALTVEAVSHLLGAGTKGTGERLKTFRGAQLYTLVHGSLVGSLGLLELLLDVVPLHLNGRHLGMLA